jgi:hypothetical protein
MHPTVSNNPKAKRTSSVSLAPAAPEPLLVRISEACRISGFSRSDLYRRATRNEVLFVKAGRMTLVDFASLKAAVSALPRAAINTQS